MIDRLVRHPWTILAVGLGLTLAGCKSGSGGY